MTVPRRLAAGAALVVAGLTLAATASGTSEPRTPTQRAKLHAIRSEVRGLEREVELMELSAARYADWQACLHGVPVSEYGDPDRQAGFLYDERDGTGPGFRPALAIDRKSRPRREDYLFLNFSRRSNCRSDAPLPGGTADPASAHSARLRGPSLRSTLTDLERRVARMKRAARGLLASSEHFDAWESCVSWVPVTEYGDPDGRFGYLFGGRGAAVPGYRPALSIDRSDWDDPDYMFLAFVGGDRPGRRCQDEPGEGID